MQNSDFMTRLTILYGSQHSSVVFARKTATFGPELQVSVCTRPHLSYCASKSAWLALELLVSMGSSPHLWFMHSKQWLLDPNNKSIWVPDITCRFVHAIQRDLHPNNLSLWVPPLTFGFFMQNIYFWRRITSLYGSQTSPVVLCMQNSVINIRIASL